MCIQAATQHTYVYAQTKLTAEKHFTSLADAVWIPAIKTAYASKREIDRFK